MLREVRTVDTDATGVNYEFTEGHVQRAARPLQVRCDCRRRPDVDAEGAVRTVKRDPRGVAWAATNSCAGTEELQYAREAGSAGRGRLAQVDDPQRSLVDGRVSVIGFHTVFANVQVGDCRWS